MRDFRKFCRPRVTKYPKLGDVQIKLNCGEIISVSAKEYNKIKSFFKIYSIIGEASNTIGNLKVYDTELDKNTIISPTDYSNNKSRYELTEIIGNIPVSNRNEGDIKLYNEDLNQHIVITFQNWSQNYDNISDDWTLEGLQGITTYEEEDAEDGYYVIGYNGNTLIISSDDYPKVSNNWEKLDTIVKDNDSSD